MIIQTVRFGTESVQVTFVTDDPSLPAHAMNVQRDACPEHVARLQRAADALLLASLGVIPELPPPSPLTPRQCDVLRLLAEGESVTGIGSVLYLAPSTVKKHIARVYRVLGVRNRASAVMAAVNAGLIHTKEAE